MLLALGLAVVLSVVEFFSESIAHRIERFHREIVSLNGGLMLGFLFLMVFPELFKDPGDSGQKAFFFLLVGFTLFHLAEKYVYRHAHSMHERQHELDLLHLVGVYSMGLIEGIALFLSIDLIGTPTGQLLFIHLLLNSVNASLLMAHITREITQNRLWDAVLALGPLTGFALALGLAANAPAARILFSFVAGCLLYVVVRDIIPDHEHGDTSLFIIGVFISMLFSQMAGFLY